MVQYVQEELQKKSKILKKLFARYQQKESELTEVEVPNSASHTTTAAMLDFRITCFLFSA